MTSLSGVPPKGLREWFSLLFPMVSPIIVGVVLFFVFLLAGVWVWSTMDDSDYWVAICNDCSELGGDLFLEKGFFVSNVSCENGEDSFRVRFFYFHLADGFAYGKSPIGWC